MQLACNSAAGAFVHQQQRRVGLRSRDADAGRLAFVEVGQLGGRNRFGPDAQPTRRQRAGDLALPARHAAGEHLVANLRRYPHLAEEAPEPNDS